MTQQRSGPSQAKPAAGEGQRIGVHSAGSRPCPACGQPVNVLASICPTCGESLPSRNKKIRCRHCHGTASANLVICPRCGRELRPAASRLLTWGIPALLVLLFAALFLMRSGGTSPVAWAQVRIERTAAFVGDLGDRLQPEITIETLPVEEDIEDQLVSAPAPTLPANSVNQVQQPAATEQPTATPQEAAIVPPAATATATATAAPTATALPTATAIPELPTATESATATIPPATATTLPVTATPSLRVTATVPSTVLATATTAAVTATRTATQSVTARLVLPTPTAVVRTAETYTVRVGDTLFDLALANDISLDLLLAANELTADDVYTIQPGDTLLIPDPDTALPATPTPMPTATATAVAGSTYTVQAGDTFMAIALRNRITTQALLDANGLTLAEARALRPGQELIIPGSSQPTATPAATVTPAATTTAAIAPSSNDATGEIRLDAPVLRTPENGTVVSCDKPESLVWNPVPFIQEDDLYLVHLGYVNSSPGADGSEEIVWVLEQQRPSATTLWELDANLCGLAPFDFGRQWRWYVEVVERATDGTLNPVSDPSPVWGFSWQ